MHSRLDQIMLYATSPFAVTTSALCLGPAGESLPFLPRHACSYLGLLCPYVLDREAFWSDTHFHWSGVAPGCSSHGGTWRFCRWRVWGMSSFRDV